MPTIPFDGLHMAAGEIDGPYTDLTYVTGDTPAVVTTSEVAAVTMAARTVVARDGTGKLVPAVVSGGVSNAIGITNNAVDITITGASPGKVACIRAGCFNPDALVWDATFTTDALKRLAFEAKGVQIFLVKPLFTS